MMYLRTDLSSLFILNNESRINMIVKIIIKMMKKIVNEYEVQVNET